MGNVQASTHIQAPPERVFAVASDIPNAAETISGIKKVTMETEGPVGVGTVWTETRRFGKKDATERLEIFHFDPPNSYTVLCDSHGAHYESILRCKPEGGGARLEMEMSCTPVTIGAKIFTPLMAPLMNRMVRKCMQQDLEDIKSSCEGRATTPERAAPA